MSISSRHLCGGSVALALATLAACSGSNDSPAQPPPTAQALEDQFGAGFGRLFRVQPNTDAADPQAADIVAVSFTGDPVPVP
jgi:hypothetical protein